MWGERMTELSIFIDESGDFGEVTERPAYYLVTLVFHNQSDNIEEQVKKLEGSVKASGFDLEYIHTGPVIRREDVFSAYSIDERRKLLYNKLNFLNGIPVSYETVVVNRKEAADKISLSGKLAKKISEVMQLQCFESRSRHLPDTSPQKLHTGRRIRNLTCHVHPGQVQPLK